MRKSVWYVIRKIRNFFRLIAGPALGIIFCVSVLATSCFGNYIMAILYPLVLYIEHKKFRTLMDQAVGFWLFVLMSALEFVLGVKVRVNGDPIDCEKPAIIIMNHRTRLDWLYMFNAFYRINPWLVTTLKITLKYELQYLIGVGDGMLASNFMFMRRNMDEDGPMLEESIEYFSGCGKNYQILIFPEATDKSDYTTMRSNQFAAKMGLEPLNYCLYPRVGGFVYLLKKMRERNYISNVYDITIGYPNNIVQNELMLGLRGVVPKNVHFDIKKIEMDEIPEEDEKVGEWLTKLWQKKDKKLMRFYEPQLASRRRFDKETIEPIWVKDSWRQFTVKFIAFFIWTFLCSLWIYHLTFIWIIQVLVAYMMISKMYIFLRHGRVDKMIRYYWKKQNGLLEKAKTTKIQKEAD